MSIEDKLLTIADNEQKVYDAGKKAEYDTFWDSYQKNGTRTYYSNAFSGDGWTDTTFVPKYDIVVVDSGINLFANMKVADLDKRLNDCSVSLDTSGATNLDYAFCSDTIRVVPEVSTVSMETLYCTFNYSRQIEKIKKLVLKEDGSQVFYETFTGCYALKDIAIEGTIGYTINFQWSPLSVESMKSIILHLKNYAGTEKAYRYTIRFSKACWAALEADSPSPDTVTWQTYVQAALGWSI